MSTKKLKLFLLLFLQSAVVAFAQQDLLSDLNPNGSWYSDESYDAAYESTLKQLQRTWLFVRGDFDCSFPTPTTKFSFNGKLKSVTFKPNGLGSIAFNRESYLVEIPFTYTKKKDKITISINYLRAKVSSTISKEELNNLSQRRKDNIERTRNEYLVDARKNGTRKRTFTMYRIDDYLVLHGEFYNDELSFLIKETSMFVSKEYQAIIDERAAAKAKAEEEEREAKIKADEEAKRAWDKRIKEIYAAPNDSNVFTRWAKNYIHAADEAHKCIYGVGLPFEEKTLPKYEFSPEDEVVSSIDYINDSTATVKLNNTYNENYKIALKFAKENGIWKVDYIPSGIWDHWRYMIRQARIKYEDE